MRKSFNPGCSCFMCRRGRGSAAGSMTVRAAKRRLRHRAREELRKTGDLVDAVIVPTPYTD